MEEIRLRLHYFLQFQRTRARSSQPSAVPGAAAAQEAFVAEERDLTRERELQRRLDSDKPLPQFWRNKYVVEADRNWDAFYKRHANRFFKDRHYLDMEFGGITDGFEGTLMEVGCGVGNAAIPLLEAHPKLTVYAMDFAASAISILQQHEMVRSGRCVANVWDFCSGPPLPPCVPAAGVDLATMMFVLSAIAPERMEQCVRNVLAAVRRGGKVLLRDYGRFDEAQVRFKPSNKLDDDFYVRQDGTCSYFFTTERLHELFAAVGARCLHLEYVRRAYTIRDRPEPMHRVWVQAAFEKL